MAKQNNFKINKYKLFNILVKLKIKLLMQNKINKHHQKIKQIINPNRNKIHIQNQKKKI